MSLIKCSFNLEHDMESLINRSIGEYQYVQSFLISYVAQADVHYGGFHSNHENNIVKKEWGSDILPLVSF